LRVALVIERFEPEAGGVEGVVWNVAHRLAEAGEEVHVIARRVAPPGTLHPVRGIEVHRVEAPTVWQPLRVLAFSRGAARQARALGAEVVHTFSRTRHQDVYRAGGGSHADFLARSYGPWGLALRRVSPRHRVLLGIERRVFADPHQVIQCNSGMVRDEIAARYGVADERLVVIPNGVDLERFHPGRRDAEGARLRDELGAKDRTVWVLVGNGLWRKGLDTALAALARSADRETELWVAGRDDPEPWRRRAAAAGVAERVRFLGARRDVETVYAAGDALLLPTRYDAFANATLEAAAAGLPVLTSAANGAADLLRDAGYVVRDPEDAAGFAAALDALGDRVTRAELGRRARATAETLSWERHVEALRALYRTVRARSRL
jgi:UDP-glucose:(heptosyl)LPS alpha-1,3-glucosyltransferase